MERGDYDAILSFLTDGIVPQNVPSTIGNFKNRASKFTIQNGKLFRDNLPVLLEEELEAVWEQIHGHSGVNKTWDKIKSNMMYFSPMDLRTILFSGR